MPNVVNMEIYYLFDEKDKKEKLLSKGLNVVELEPVKMPTVVIATQTDKEIFIKPVDVQNISKNWFKYHSKRKNAVNRREERVKKEKKATQISKQ